MCNPALAIQAAGAATSATGAFFAAKGQKLALRSQAHLDDLNAKLSDDSARLAMQQGQEAEVQAKLRTAQIKSGQRVAYGAGGVDLGEGTAALALTSTEVMGDIDALTINQNATREAGARRIQSADYRNKALLGRATAKGISPLTQTLTSLLGSAASFAGSAQGSKMLGGGG